MTQPNRRTYLSIVASSRRAACGYKFAYNIIAMKIMTAPTVWLYRDGQWFTLMTESWTRDKGTRGWYGTAVHCSGMLLVAEIMQQQTDSPIKRMACKSTSPAASIIHCRACVNTPTRRGRMRLRLGLRIANVSVCGMEYTRLMRSFVRSMRRISGYCRKSLSDCKVTYKQDRPTIVPRERGG